MIIVVVGGQVAVSRGNSTNRGVKNGTEIERYRVQSPQIAFKNKTQDEEKIAEV